VNRFTTLRASKFRPHLGKVAVTLAVFWSLAASGGGWSPQGATSPSSACLAYAPAIASPSAVPEPWRAPNCGTRPAGGWSGTGTP